MARMSIDDSFLRDPRVRRLAKMIGWSRRETMSTLLDIFAMCYDRVSEFLPEHDIATCAEQDGLECPGFVAKMIEAGLASRTRNPRMIRVAGAEERLLYLRRQSALGRQGGLKSAERRRKEGKGHTKGRLRVASGDPQAAFNLPDPVPDPVPSPSPVSALALVPEPPARATTTVTELVDGVERARSYEISRLVKAIFPQQLKAFNALRTELQLTASMPAMQPVGDPAEVELRNLLRSLPTLEGVEERALHALAVREKEARDKRSLDYFGTSVWNEKSFGRAQSMSSTQQRAAPKPNGSVFDALDEAYRDHKDKETVH